MLIAGAFTHTDIKEEDLPEGDEINMCEGMDRYYFKDLKIKEWRKKEKQLDLKKVNVLELKRKTRRKTKYFKRTT